MIRAPALAGLPASRGPSRAFLAPGAPLSLQSFPRTWSTSVPAELSSHLEHPVLCFGDCGFLVTWAVSGGSWSAAAACHLWDRKLHPGAQEVLFGARGAGGPWMAILKKVFPYFLEQNTLILHLSSPISEVNYLFKEPCLFLVENYL